MRTSPTVEQLSEAFGNDILHGRHTAALATRIFDRTHEALGIGGSQRRLLEVACVLHDIGYRKSPRNHAAESAAIIRGHSLRGLSAADRACVADAVALHQGSAKAEGTSGQSPRRRRPSRSRALAAYLRVADGLDRGRIQDASIRRVLRRRDGFTVVVRSRWYERNVERARRKSDLWHEVFSHDIRFVTAKPAPRPFLFSGIVVPGDTVIEALRKILLSRYRVMTDSRELALAGSLEKGVHDFRVALRRLRTALRLFKSYVPAGSAGEIREALAVVADKLGTSRDDHVWDRFLHKRRVRERLNGDASYREYAQCCHRRSVDTEPYIESVLRGDECREVLRRTAVLLRSEIPSVLYADRSGPLRAFARKRLGRLRHRIDKRRSLKREASAETMHKLRKFCRRERYAAEFFAPLLPAAGRLVLPRLKALTNSLGTIHDMDVALQRSRDKACPVMPAAVRNEVNRTREEQMKRFRKAWKKVRSDAFEKALKKAVEDSGAR